MMRSLHGHSAVAIGGGLKERLLPDHELALDHDAMEGDEDFIGTVGGRLRFAPFVGFGVAAQVLVADVGFDVFGDANDDDRQKTWIGIDLNRC